VVAPLQAQPLTAQVDSRHELTQRSEADDAIAGKRAQ